MKMRLFLITLVLLNCKLTFADEAIINLNATDLELLKVCQIEQKFSKKNIDLKTCFDEKKENGDYHDLLKYETFEDLKY